MNICQINTHDFCTFRANFFSKLSLCHFNKKTSAIVQWSPLPHYDTEVDVKGYEISIHDLSNDSLHLKLITGSHKIFYRLHHLTPMTEYSLRIAATNFEGTGPYSPAIVFETRGRQLYKKLQYNTNLPNSCNSLVYPLYVMEVFCVFIDKQMQIK